MSLAALSNDLENIPALDDLALAIETEDAQADVVVIPRPVPLTVQHDEVVFGDGPIELHSLARYSRAMRSR
jgi:hypothetical protein